MDTEHDRIREAVERTSRALTDAIATRHEGVLGNNDPELRHAAWLLGTEAIGAARVALRAAVADLTEWHRPKGA